MDSMDEKKLDAYDVMVKLLEVLEKQIEVDKTPYPKEKKERIKIQIKKMDIAFSKNEEFMGDKNTFNQSQIASVGSQSSATDNTFNQVNNSSQPLDFIQISQQLTKLRTELAKQAQDVTHYKSLGEVACAEEAAQQKNYPGVVKHLATAGKWVLEKTQEIGTDILTEIIKKEMGL